MQLLNIDISCTVGVGADKECGVLEKGKQHDALAECASLATAKRA